MAIEETYSQMLPPDMVAFFDSFSISVSIADPTVADCPLVYVNQAFVDMSGRDASRCLGTNCRFLQGALTDRTATLELGQAIHDEISVSASLINYRANGEAFYNVMALKPLRIPRQKTLVMACQHGFKPVQSINDPEKAIQTIESAWLSIRNHIKFERSGLCDNDIFRLDALSMRFETTFARAQDAVIRHSATKTAALLAEIARKQSGEVTEELRKMRQFG